MISNLEKYYSPEIELLIICARTKLNSEKSTRLKELLQKNINWEYLINLARRNKVLPLLYWHLASICSTLVPEIYMSQLKFYFHKNSRSNLYITKELLKILKVFEENKIPAIPYKGPVLAHSIYGNLALREFSDLDILIQKKDFYKTKELLYKEGYYSDRDLDISQEKASLQYYCDFTFSRDDDIYLEIHWDILNRYFSIPFNTKLFFERFERVSLASEAVTSFSPEVLLLVLCIQGAKYYWKTLGSICDIAELINVKKNINWDWVFKYASTLGIKRILCLGLFLARDLLEADLPNEILQKIQVAHLPKTVVPQIYARLFGSPKGWPEPIEVCLFQLKVRDRLIDKITYFLRYALTPSLGDWQFVHLPEHLYLLYYLIRPIRLVGKYIFRLFGGEMLSAYEKTPIEVIDKMLELAKVGPLDIVYDLGCGDGRVVIRAAKKYGACGIGIDIDPKRIEESKINAYKEGVEQLVKFIKHDALTMDFSSATVIIFFLNFLVTPEVGRHLQKQLKVGTRILSHCSYLREWTPSKTQIMQEANGHIHTLYLWEVEKSQVQPKQKNAQEALSSISNSS